MADNDSRPEQAEAATRLGRIVFRAWRRGFREADLILGPFAERVGPELSADELDAFEALLMLDDDHQIYAWIIETQPAPPEHETPVMARIRAFMREHVAAVTAAGAG